MADGLQKAPQKTVKCNLMSRTREIGKEYTIA